MSAFRFATMVTVSFILVSGSGLRMVQPGEITTQPSIDKSLFSDPATLDQQAREYARGDDVALAKIDGLLQRKSPHADWVAAELLWRMARQNRMTDQLADHAADLLDADDIFTQALAEWALAIKVGIANNAPTEVYPGQQSPEWFTRWSAIDPDRHIAFDYARCGILWNVYRQSDSCLNSSLKYLARAEGVLAEIKALAPDRLPEAEAAFQRAGQTIGALEQSIASNSRDLLRHRALWIRTRMQLRDVVLANPAVDFEQIVFTQRHAAHSLRNITGSQYPWTHKPGGDIQLKSGFAPSDKVEPIINRQLGPGHVHGMDLSWDARRLVFGYATQPLWPPSWDTGPNCSPYVFQLRKEQPPTHIYEIRLDGSELHQVTDHPVSSDFEPTWTADERIVFASDRSGRSSECGTFSSDHTVINVYCVNRDGGDLRRLGDNKDIDRYPHSLDNGLIGYTRWEYQERHFTEVHALWTIRADGMHADTLFNQHMSAPWGLRDTRSIPGSGRLISIATGHHTLAYGPVVLIDPRYGPNDSRGIETVTPHCVPQEGPPAGGRVAQGGVPDQGGLYQTPYALSETCYLVSFSHDMPSYRENKNSHYNDTQFGVYLIDAYGNKELIHRDPVYSCSFPIPVRSRPAPPVVASLETTHHDGTNTATCFIADVHEGLEGVTPGTVKYIRISQRVGWPLDHEIGAMRYIPGNAYQKQFGFWAWSPVRVLGTVPVDEDGSAHFQLPANTAVYFQALDENKMEIRRMRSHISFERGESRSCIGCHETRPVVPGTMRKMPLALKHPATLPKAPCWGADRLLDYESMIQPIFDAHCVRCHGGDEPDGGLDLCGDLDDTQFVRSFRSLFNDRRDGRTGPTTDPLVAISDRFSGASISRPKQFGSHQSRLITILLDDTEHKKEVQLSDDQWETLVTWVDANAPYFSTFFNRRPTEGDAPLRTIRIDPNTLSRIDSP